MNKERKSVLNLWKELLKNQDSGIHFSTTNRYKKFKGIKEKVGLFINNPSEEIFTSFWGLLNEDIKKEDRQKINSALAYFVVPNDIIPEEIYGPMGYVDDIYLCTVVLKEIQEKYGIDLLKSLWECDEDFEEVLEVSYQRSLDILEEKGVVEDILKYSGLK